MGRFSICLTYYLTKTSETSKQTPSKVNGGRKNRLNLLQILQAGQHLDSQLLIARHQKILQSLIARALDDDCYVALAGIDLSAAFDVVDIELLIKRLIIKGLPGDVINLIKIWLKERFFSC